MEKPVSNAFIFHFFDNYADILPSICTFAAQN